VTSVDEQRIRQIVREEIKKAANEKAADVVLTIDGEKSLVPFLRR